MQKTFKKTIKKPVKFFLSLLSLGGEKQYTPYRNRKNKHQPEYQRFMDRVKNGELPTRYKEMAALVTEGPVVELGSADGTLCLALNEHLGSDLRVSGVEVTEFRHNEALENKDIFKKLGINVQNVKFYHLDVESAQKKDLEKIFVGCKTVIMSRFIYHLRENAFQLFNQLRKYEEISYLVMIGNHNKERRYHNGEKHKLGEYLYYATNEGMRDLAESNGFFVLKSGYLKNSNDPYVVAQRGEN